MKGTLNKQNNAFSVIYFMLTSIGRISPPINSITNHDKYKDLFKWASIIGDPRRKESQTEKYIDDVMNSYEQQI